MIHELIQIGYWCGPGLALPDPRWFVDPSWDPALRARVRDYLDRGYYAFGAPGASWCRFGCQPGDHEMGRADLTDGAYLWPEGLSHYVAYHAVRLPDEFVAHVLERDPPDGIDDRGQRRKRPLTTELPSLDWWRAQVDWRGSAR